MWYNVYLSLAFVLIVQRILLTFEIFLQTFGINLLNSKNQQQFFHIFHDFKNSSSDRKTRFGWQWQSYHSKRWPGPGSNIWLRRIHEFRQLGQPPLSTMSLQDDCYLLDCSVLLCSRDRNRTTRWRVDILVVTDYLWFLVSLHRRLKVWITILFIGRLHFWSIKGIFLSWTYEDSVRHGTVIWNHDSLVTNNNRSSWYC